MLGGHLPHCHAHMPFNGMEATIFRLVFVFQTSRSDAERWSEAPIHGVPSVCCEVYPQACLHLNVPPPPGACTHGVDEVAIIYTLQPLLHQSDWAMCSSAGLDC